MTQKSEFEEQLLIESELARRLLEADENTRAKLYGPVYDQIYEISLRYRGLEAEDQQFGSAPYMVPILTRLSRAGDQVLEVGCGCGYLSLELARSGRQVTGVDIASVAIEQAKKHAERLPSGAAEFVCVNGLKLPFPSDSFDLVFSVEVLEHLHEADVPRYLAGAFRVLRPGGHFWVKTPSRLLDISAEERFGVDDHSHHHGDDPNVHLKEWTYAELMPLLEQAGFRDLTSFWQRPSIKFFPRLPARFKLNAERALRWLPFTRLRRPLMYQARVGDISIVGRKPT
jgi:ubiquinone/menaquinone biosynthesis C-methylase UbiE